MAETVETTRFQWQLELTQFLASIREADGATTAQAQRMTSQLVRAINACTAAEKEAAKAAKATEAARLASANATTAALQRTTVAVKSTTQAAQGFRAAAVQIPDVISQLAAGTPVMTVLTQQGLQVGQQWAIMGGSLAAVGSIAAALAPVLLALGGTWYYLSKQEKEAEKATAAAAEEASKAQGIYQGLTRVMLDIEEAYRLATGAITSHELAAEKQAAGLRTLVDAERAVIRAKYDALDAEIALADAEVSRRERAVRYVGGKIAEEELASATAARDSLTVAQDRQLAILNRLGQREKEELTDLALTVQLQDEARSGRERGTQAIRDETSARHALVAVQAQEAAANSAAIAGWVSFRRDARAAAEALLSDEERIRVETERTTAAILARGEALGETGQAAQYAADVETAAQRRISDLRERAAAESRRLADEERARDLRLRTDAVSASAAALGSFADLAQAMADEGGEASKEWARVAYAAALSQTVASGILAVQQAWASAPWPWSIPAITAATVGTAANVAKIQAAAPKFHSGLSRAPDEVPATLTTQERVLTGKGASAVGGDQGVAAANRGESPWTGPVVIQQVYGHRVLGTVLHDALGLPGSPLRRDIRALTRSPAAGRIA